MRGVIRRANNSIPINISGELLPTIMATKYLSKYLEKHIQVTLGGLRSVTAPYRPLLVAD